MIRTSGFILSVAMAFGASPALSQSPSHSEEDLAILADFVRMQDLGLVAGANVKCRPEGEQAVRKFHQRFDPRLIALAGWLQKTFSDEELKAARAKIHGPDHVPLVPSCPIPAEQIDASEAAYVEALARLEVSAQASTPGEGR